MVSEKVPVSVVIPTYRRFTELKLTIEKICACSPLPEEIIIGVDRDGGLEDVEKLLSQLPIRGHCFEAVERSGPGGIRNRLYNEAVSEWLVSLDDDSFPIDKVFFEDVLRLSQEVPQNCAVVDIAFFEEGDREIEVGDTLEKGFHFHGGASLIRREAICRVRNYPMLKEAYGLEEAVMTLFLQDCGYEIFWTDRVRIFHATDGSRRDSLPCRVAEARNGFLFIIIAVPTILVLPFLLKSIVSGLRILRGDLIALAGCSISALRMYPIMKKGRRPVSVRSSLKLLFLRYL